MLSHSEANPVAKEAVDSGDSLSISAFSSKGLLADLPEIFSNASGSVRKNVTDFRFSAEGVLELRNMTELNYTAPESTTLIEVLGPVQRAPDDSANSFKCYAILIPRPSWWSNAGVPLAHLDKPKNITQQTLFLLPVDPDQKYTLIVGPSENATCLVNHVRSYLLPR